jgi:hypothetical protein
MLLTSSTRLLITTIHNYPHSFPQACTGKTEDTLQAAVEKPVDCLGILGEWKGDSFRNTKACGKSLDLSRVLQQVTNTKYAI